MLHLRSRRSSTRGSGWLQAQALTHQDLAVDIEPLGVWWNVFSTARLHVSFAVLT